MANRVRKTKIEKVRQELKKGKSYRQALLKTGYSENTANMGIENKVIREAIIKNTQELQKEDITIELVIKRLDEDRELARKKKDISTMAKIDELLGKYLQMFGLQQHTINIYNAPKDSEELRARQRKIASERQQIERNT